MAPILQMTFREEKPLALGTQNEIPAILLSLREGPTAPDRTSRAGAARGAKKGQASLRGER